MAKSSKKLISAFSVDRETHDFAKKAIALATPIILQRVVSVFVNLLDNIMVGSMGDISVSACSIANQFFMLYMCVTSGIIGGAVIISAQAYGKGDEDIIKRMMSISLMLSILNSFLFFALTQFFAEEIIRIYSNQQSILEPASSYLRIISYSYLMFAVSTALTMILRTVQCVRLGFYVECASSVINAFLNYVLIFGHLGAPELGIEGAAIATVLARFIGLLIAVMYTFIVDKRLHYRIKDVVKLPDRKLMSTFIKCGIPVLVGDTLMMLNSTFQTMITGRISSSYITANSIVHVIWQIAALAAMGFETAASIMIGNDIGTGNMEKVQKDGERFFKLSVFYGILAAIIVLLVGPFLLQFYNISGEAINMAQSMIKSASLVVFMMVIQMVTTKGVIKAGGKTKDLMIMDLLSCFCFGLPLGYIAAFVLHLPPFLIYIVIRGDYLIKALWGVFRLKKKDWAVGLVY